MVRPPEIRKEYPEVYKDLMKKQSAEDKFLKIVDAYGGGATGKAEAVKQAFAMSVDRSYYSYPFLCYYKASC